LADEDLDSAILEGVLYCEPTIDILDSKHAGYRGVKDPTLLEIAAQQGRILISHDRRTMTRYFCDRLAAGKSSPGLFIVPQQTVIGDVIELLVLIWTASQPNDWVDAITYLPYR
jgi:hypothetical protein